MRELVWCFGVLVLCLAGCSDDKVDANTTSEQVEDMSASKDMTNVDASMVDQASQDMLAVPDFAMTQPDLREEEDMVMPQDMSRVQDLGSACDGVVCEAEGVCDGGQCVCPPSRTGARCERACEVVWATSDVKGPVMRFNYSENVEHMLWNDPTIIQEGDGWVMWLSGGIVPKSKTDKSVSLYRATSPDGLTWQLNISPVLTPGQPGSWDAKKVETPSVIRDDAGVYHLYYSGTDSEVEDGVYAIGHATSSDGVTWVKDPANPVIQPVTQGSDWGVFTAAEPGALWDSESKSIHLYYVSAGGSADRQGVFAIMRGTSKDGTTFEFHKDAQGNLEPVWSLTDSYAKEPGFVYRGFSTPSVTKTRDGVIHLVHDVVVRQDVPGQENGFEQASVSWATSVDGVTFKEEGVDLIKRRDGLWYEREVRAPTLVEGSQGLRLWFAGGKKIQLGGPAEDDGLNWAAHLESFGYLEGGYVCQ